jgi:DNA polymerase I
MTDVNGTLYRLIDEDHKDWVIIVVPEEELDELSLYIKEDGGVDGVSIIPVNMYLLGKKVSGLKVYTDPDHLDNILKKIRMRFPEAKFYEDDIRFSNKYLLKNMLSPSKWYRVQYIESGSSGNVVTGVLKGLDYSAELLHFPNLRILALDMIVASPIGEPDPDTDPILAITISGGSIDQQFILSDSDAELINKLNKLVADYNPHLILTFEGNSFIWPYLTERAKNLNLNINIGVFNQEIHQSLHGHYSIPGRLNIDLKEYVEGNPLLQRKTIEELAEFLGLPAARKPLDRLLYFEIWNQNRSALLEYSKWKVQVILRAFELLMEEIFSLSAITGLPADYVLTASTGYQVENYIMKNALSMGEIIVKPPGHWRGTYTGGLVLPPEPGIHRDICVIDFKSMYPNIIMKYNISPDTIVRESTASNKIRYYDEVGVGIDLSKEGLFPKIIKKLIDERDKIKVQIDKYGAGSVERRILDAHQRVLKVLANAMYGYMGWTGARFYSWEGAQLVTYLGREIITKSKEKCEELGLKIVYGDTDSLFVNYDEDKIRRLLHWIEDELGMEAKIDRIYKVLLFTEAKKRYAGLTIEDYIDIVGLEYVRRDWCEYAKETQYKLIDMVLRDRNKEEILNYFRERVKKLNDQKVSMEKLIIWEQITRRLDEYKAMSPHIAVAEELALKGWKIRKGMFIGYIILRGSGPLYKRAVHHTMARIEDIDWEYYIYKQVIPVSARVLEPIGITKDDLESIASGLHFGMDRFLM